MESPLEAVEHRPLRPTGLRDDVRDESQEANARNRPLAQKLGIYSGGHHVGVGEQRGTLGHD
jgi:hypothetical protein